MQTSTKKAQIIKMNRMRCKNSDIARLLGVSRQYVSHVLHESSNGREYKASRTRNKKFITTGEASSLLGVSEATVRRWVDQGKLLSFRINIGRRDRRIDAAELERIIINTASNHERTS